MKQFNAAYNIKFAGAVCLVCAILVSTSAVSLKERQLANEIAFKQKSILSMAGFIEEGERLSNAEAQERFDANIRPRVVVLESGEYVENDEELAQTYDQQKALSDPEQSKKAPEKNVAKLLRLPYNAFVYHVLKEDGTTIDTVILPVEGKGLWSTLYGFLALEPDLKTVRGITFYDHAETPGLGGEISNPAWQAKWVGKRAVDDDGTPVIEVAKGPATSDTQIDGLSGATLTSRGVTNLVQFWLGDNGFGPYLAQMRKGGNI